MNLESQVIPLQQAKRLKELGVKQESYFMFLPYFNDENGKTYGFNLTETYSDGGTGTPFADPEKGFSAFTCAELGEMLPQQYITYKSHYEATGEPCYLIWETKGIIPQGKPKEIGDTEAEARGAMLIHLIENKLITVEQINSKA